MTFPTDVPSDIPRSRTVTVRQRVANDPTRYVIDMGDGISGPEIGFYPGPRALTPGQRVRAKWNKDMWQWQLTGPGFSGCDVEYVDTDQWGSEVMYFTQITAADDFIIGMDGNTISVRTFASGVIGNVAVDTQAVSVGSVVFAALSPNEDYWAVLGNTSPRIEVYAFNNVTGAIGAKVSDPASTPPNVGSGSLSWSPSGAYISVTHTVFPFVSIYAWSAGFGSLLAGPPDSPHGDVSSISGGYYVLWNPAETAVVITYNVDIPSSSNAIGATAFAWSSGFGSRLSGQTTEGERHYGAVFTSDGLRILFTSNGGAAAIASHIREAVHPYIFDPSTGFGAEGAVQTCGPTLESASLRIIPVLFSNDSWVLYGHRDVNGDRERAAVYGLVSYNPGDNTLGTCCTAIEDGASGFTTFDWVANPIVSHDEQYLILGEALGSLSISVAKANSLEGLSISDLLNVSIA